MEETEKLIGEMLWFLYSSNEEDSEEEGDIWVGRKEQPQNKSNLNKNAEVFRSDGTTKFKLSAYNAEQNSTYQTVLEDCQSSYGLVAECETDENLHKETKESLDNTAESVTIQSSGCSVLINGEADPHEFNWASVPTHHRPNSHSEKKSCKRTRLSNITIYFNNKSNIVQDDHAIRAPHDQKLNVKRAVQDINKPVLLDTDDYNQKLREKCREAGDLFMTEVNHGIYGKDIGHPIVGSSDYFQAAQNYAIYGKAFLDMPSNHGSEHVKENTWQDLATDLWISEEQKGEKPILSTLDQELFSILNSVPAVSAESNGSIDNSFKDFSDNLESSNINNQSTPTTNKDAAYQYSAATFSASNEFYPTQPHQGNNYWYAPTAHSTMSGSTAYYMEQQGANEYVGYNHSYAQSIPCQTYAGHYPCSTPSYYGASNMAYPATYMRDQSPFINCQQTTTSYYERTQTQTYHPPLPQNRFPNSPHGFPFFTQQLRVSDSYSSSQSTALHISQQRVPYPNNYYGQQSNYMPPPATAWNNTTRYFNRPLQNVLPNKDLVSRLTDRGTQTTILEGATVV